MANSEVIKIKKYSNRRLYDTSKSRYVTLEELKNMIVDGVAFEVYDSKTNENITRMVLLQALLSEETFDKPILSEQSLRNLVLFFHGPFRGAMAAYFEECLPAFLDAQRNMHDKFGASLSAADMEKITALQAMMTRQVLEQYVFGGVEKFIDAQKQMQQNMQNMMGGNMFNFSDFFTPPTPSKTSKDKE